LANGDCPLGATEKVPAGRKTAAPPRKTGAWLIAVIVLSVLGCGTLTLPLASAPSPPGPQHLLESSPSASRFGPEPG
jgi:hypothetical protein